jgi:hypothetical protein
MCLRQVLKNVCIFCCIAFVVRHVSLPYSRIDITFELKMRIECGFCADGFGCPDVVEHDKSCFALPILAEIS